MFPYQLLLESAQLAFLLNTRTADMDAAVMTMANRAPMVKVMVKESLPSVRGLELVVDCDDSTVRFGALLLDGKAAAILERDCKTNQEVWVPYLSS